MNSSAKSRKRGEIRTGTDSDPDYWKPLFNQAVPFVGISVGLSQDASQRANRDLTVSGDNGCVDDFPGSANKFDVTAYLGCLFDSGCFQTALHLSKRERAKPPQLRPQ